MKLIGRHEQNSVRSVSVEEKMVCKHLTSHTFFLICLLMFNLNHLCIYDSNKTLFCMTEEKKSSISVEYSKA